MSATHSLPLSFPSHIIDLQKHKRSEMAATELHFHTVRYVQIFEERLAISEKVIQSSLRQKCWFWTLPSKLKDKTPAHAFSFFPNPQYLACFHICFSVASKAAYQNASYRTIWRPQVSQLNYSSCWCSWSRFRIHSFIDFLFLV